MKTLRLILGDQLNLQHSWFEQTNERIVYAMLELKQESLYVTHHIQKIAAFFAAMEQFAESLRVSGHSIIYLKIDAAGNSGSLTEEIAKLIASENIGRFEYQQPDEFRLQKQLSDFCQSLSKPSEVFETEDFFCKP